MFDAGTYEGDLEAAIGRLGSRIEVVTWAIDECSRRGERFRAQAFMLEFELLAGERARLVMLLQSHLTGD